MREWASDPRAWVWIIQGVPILPDDVLSRPDDDQLYEFICAKLAQ